MKCIPQYRAGHIVDAQLNVWLEKMSFAYCLFLINWCMIDSQCCVSVWCIAKWVSYVYIHKYICLLFHILFHYGLLWDIENGSCAIQRFTMLCYFLVYSKVIQWFTFAFFSIMILKILCIITPCAVLCCKVLAFYFMYSSVYLLIPNSQFIPPPLSPSVTVSLFSMSVSLFMFCE